MTIDFENGEPAGMRHGGSFFTNADTLDALDIEARRTHVRMCGEIAVPCGRAVELLGNVVLCLKDGALSILEDEPEGTEP